MSASRRGRGLLAPRGSVLLAALLIGCSLHPTPDRPDPKAAVVAMTERGWTGGDLDIFSSLTADTVVFHYAGTPRVMSSEQLRSGVARWREAFPDLRMSVDEIIGEGDLVAGRFTLSGTHEGPWRGAAPTGRRVSMALMMFFRFEDGLLVELWEVDDQLGLQRQLGLLLP